MLDKIEIKEEEDQAFIIFTMQALDLAPNPAGVCLAYAQIGAEEFLSYNTNSFDAMIDFIQVFYQQAFEKCKEELDVSNFKFNELDKKTQLSLIENTKIKLRQLFYELPLDKQQMMRDFFQRILDIYEQENHPGEKSSLKNPTEEHFVLIDEPIVFSNYTADNLNGSLVRLAELLIGNGVRTTMRLRNDCESNHVTAIGYDAASLFWRFFDANHVSMRNMNIALLAERTIIAESGIEQTPIMPELTANFVLGIWSSIKDAANLRFIIYKWKTEVTLQQQLSHWKHGENTKEKYAALCYLYKAVKESNSEAGIEKMVAAFKVLESAENFIWSVKHTLTDMQIQKLKALDLSSMYVQFTNPAVTAEMRFENANIASFMGSKKVLDIVYPDAPQENMTNLLEDLIKNLPEKSIKHLKLSAILDQLYQYKYKAETLERLMEKVDGIIGYKESFCQTFCNFFSKDKFVEKVEHLFQYNCG